MKAMISRTDVLRKISEGLVSELLNNFLVKRSRIQDESILIPYQNSIYLFPRFLSTKYYLQGR